MNRPSAASPTLLALTIVVLATSIVSSVDAQFNETKSLLAAARFRVLTPKTPRQKEIYAGLPAYKIERAHVHGTVIYVYKDEKAGIAYVGAKAEYERYRKLCAQRHLDPDFFAAHEMDPMYAHRWYGAWSPKTVWRDR